MDDRQRVRIVMSSPPMPGSIVNGVLLERDATGIRVQDRKGAEILIPWTSISIVVMNPKEPES